MFWAENNRDAENGFAKLYKRGQNLGMYHYEIQQIWLKYHLKEFNERTERKS